MAITINGTGTITGISAGGLPDGIVDTDMLAADAVTAAKLGTNSFVSYALIHDERTNGTNGGTFTAGAWQTRDLNTEVADPDGIVSIASNQFTLGAGSYLIKWSTPGTTLSLSQSRLYDVTNTAAIEYGQGSYFTTGTANTSFSCGAARVTIASSTVYEIQHRCSSSTTNTGFGFAVSFGGKEVYTKIEIYKEA
jgi:hypothetical protein